jgi:hypothetical protein
MRLIVNADYGTFSTDFYLEDIRNGKRVIIGQDNGSLIEYTLDEAVIMTYQVKPLLKMPMRLAEEFIKTVVDYASDKQIKTVNENLLQGKLSATEKHLDDMRSGFTKVLDKILESK